MAIFKLDKVMEEKIEDILKTSDSLKVSLIMRLLEMAYLAGRKSGLERARGIIGIRDIKEETFEGWVIKKIKL